VAVAVGVGEGVCVAVAVAVGVPVGVCVAVAVAVGVAVGVGVGVPPAAQKISVEFSGLPGIVLSYPPANQILVVPSVSVGKLRRAVVNAGPIPQPCPGIKTSTSFEGLGAVLPPPMTHIWPLKLSARVSPVALGIACIVPIVSAIGL